MIHALVDALSGLYIMLCRWRFSASDPSQILLSTSKPMGTLDAREREILSGYASNALAKGLAVTVKPLHLIRMRLRMFVCCRLLTGWSQ